MRSSIAPLQKDMLARQTYGEPTALPPLVIAHGLFGSGRNWGVIAKRLADQRQVITLDMRNHANSFHAMTHSYEDLAADLVQFVNEMGQPVDLLGHSMGGKAAMVATISHPKLFAKLIVADIAPVTYSHTQIEPIYAMKRLDLSKISSRQDAIAEMSGIEDDLKPFLLQSLDLKEKKWRLNLDVLASEMDKIIGFPQIAGQFTGPTLFLSGSQSAYVAADHRQRITDLFPKAKFAKIPGAGHWLHAEKPREFEAAVRVFLNLDREA